MQRSRSSAGLSLGKKSRPTQAQLRAAVEGGGKRSAGTKEDALLPRARAEIRLKTLVANYRAIHAQVPSQFMLPMIKANAYGHGAQETARALQNEPSLFGFGVASLEEGREVREAIGHPRSKKPNRVLVFSGTAPWSDEKGEYCEEHALTPVIASEEDWHRFLKGGWTKRLKYHLKFNTGMNRLGIGFAAKKQVIQALSKLEPEEHPEGVCTHFASAEDAQGALSRLQLQRFQEIRRDFIDALGLSILFHCGNSSAIWNSKHFSLEKIGDIVRPGLSLYGVPPWKGAPVRGIAPVMELAYTIALKQKLKVGERVGYGGTYKVITENRWVAILTAGYADGVLRSIGGKGTAWVAGAGCKVVGRVSMDLTAIECSASTKVGDVAIFLGEGIDPWTQAEAAGTIPYELLTSVSPRVKRIYVADR